MKKNAVRFRRGDSMPLDKENKSKYDQEYRRKYVVKKLIPFNKKKQEDMDILDWIESRPENSTQYIKRLVREDMEKASE